MELLVDMIVKCSRIELKTAQHKGNSRAAPLLLCCWPVRLFVSGVNHTYHPSSVPVQEPKCLKSLWWCHTEFPPTHRCHRPPSVGASEGDTTTEKRRQPQPPGSKHGPWVAKSSGSYISSKEVEIAPARASTTTN